MQKLSRWGWLFCAWLLWADSETKVFQGDKVHRERSGQILEAAFPTFDKCVASAEAKARVVFPDIASEAIGPGNDEQWMRNEQLKNGKRVVTLYRCFPDTVKRQDLE